MILQFGTYKIFFIFNSNGYIYESSSHTWQSLNSFWSFKFKLDFEVYPYLCIFYKNIYVLSHTSKHELMMVVYDPIIDAWNNLDLNVENDEYLYSNPNDGKLIMANGCLFFVQVSYIINDYFFLICEMKIEDTLLIPIIKFKIEHYIPSKYILGFKWQ